MGKAKTSADRRKSQQQQKTAQSQSRLDILQAQLDKQKEQAAAFQASEGLSLQRGKDFAKEVIGSGLGRLKDNKNIQNVQSQYAQMLKDAQARAKKGPGIRDVTDPTQAQGMSDIAARLKALSETGMSSQESQMLKDQALGDIGRNTSTASRRAQALLASSGVKGATAGRQLLDVQTQGAQQKTNAIRDLYLNQEQVKRSALNDLSQFELNRATSSIQAQQLGLNRDVSLENAINNRLEMSRNALADKSAFESQLATFDIAQMNKEKSIMLQSGLGFAALGQANTSAALQAQAAQNQQSGGGKVLCTLMHELGYLPDEVYASDLREGLRLGKKHPEVVKGYHFWAKPMVRFLKKFPIFIPVVKPFVLKWAQSMHDGTHPGFAYTVGAFVSKLIGKCLR